MACFTALIIFSALFMLAAALPASNTTIMISIPGGAGNSSIAGATVSAYDISPWVTAGWVPISIYLLFIFDVLSIVALIAMSLNPLAAEELAFRLIDVALPSENSPRRPPPPATFLTFPHHEPKALSSYEAEPEMDLQRLLQPLRAVEDLTPLHVSALNLRVNRDIPLDELCPADHLPPVEWEAEPAHDVENAHGYTSSLAKAETGTSVMSNGNPAPDHGVYQARLKELLFENEDVYLAFEHHIPDHKRSSVRAVHFRKFYQELRQVAEYWDTSLDEPIPAPADTTTLSPGPKDSSPDPTASSNSNQTYTGRRISTGSKMPYSHRTNLLCEFVEPILWAFGCRYDSPRSQPILNIRKLRIPIHHAGLVYRTPIERPKSSIGTLEGPLMGMQSRGETDFSASNRNADVVDLLKEVGVMLMIAQMRKREGTTEVIANADKWFVVRSRWGGGTGEAIGQALGPAGLEESLHVEAERSGEGEEPPAKKRGHERSTMALMAKEWRRKEEIKKSTLPPTSKWDKRVKYLHIGKGKNQDVDDIYLISSVNHHIAIVRLRVHPKYLEYLLNGGNPIDQEWFELPMDRSRWFDLFLPADRKEAMRGIWAVMAYLMRSN